jgi:nicotinate-nucleotide adenylyltransferase
MQRRRRNCSAAAGSSAGVTAAIGILGGIFDPVHNGHLALAARAKKIFSLSKVLFIPSGRPPHKALVRASAADRFAMLCLALGNEQGFYVWDGELRRKGISYTIDTLRALAGEFPGSRFYFIVGSDNLREIETWQCFRDVLAMVTLCVAHRPGYTARVPDALRLGRIETFPSPEIDVSSTMIRERAARGRPFRRLVPKEVAEYISIRKLYR